MRLTGRKAFLNGSHCSMSTSEKTISKSFGSMYFFNHQFTTMEKMAQKLNGGRLNIGIKKFNKLISLENI